MSLTCLFRPQDQLDVGGLREASRNGYTIIEWQNRDLRYRAVSDLSAAELDEFVRGLKARTAL